MTFSEYSAAGFCEALAAKTPVPGGGGASALVGALGAALGSMVGNYTLGKKKYEAVEGDIKRLMDEAEALRLELQSLVDEDAAAFEPLSKAYGIPKDDPARAATMETCLRAAAAVPMRIAELACRGILLHRELAEKGSALMASDAGVGAVLCWAALYGAALNVKVNTKLMADKAAAAELNARVDDLMNEHWVIASDVYEAVMGRLV